jgi:hypothetical protein
VVPLGLGLGAAAILANARLDEHFQRWHDERIKCSGTDGFSDAVKWLGDGRITIPVFAGSALLGSAFDCQDPRVLTVNQWGNRCLRTVAVGGPPLLALKYLLNGARPADEFTSRWRPFEGPYSEGAVSGHAFIGAVPFLNAAKMTDDFGLKLGLYTASALPAWSRINDRRHYLSQAILGWWLAWLATDAVHRTEPGRQNWIITAQPLADGFGVRAAYRW